MKFSKYTLASTLLMGSAMGEGPSPEALPTGRYELMHYADSPMAFTTLLDGTVSFTSKAAKANLKVEFYNMAGADDSPTSCDSAGATKFSATEFDIVEDDSKNLKGGVNAYKLSFKLPQSLRDDLPDIYTDRAYVCVRVMSELEDHVLDQIDALAIIQQSYSGRFSSSDITYKTKEMNIAQKTSDKKIDVDAYICEDVGRGRGRRKRHEKLKEITTPKTFETGQDFKICVRENYSGADFQITKVKDVQCSYGMKNTLIMTSYGKDENFIEMNNNNCIISGFEIGSCGSDALQVELHEWYTLSTGRAYGCLKVLYDSEGTANPGIDPEPCLADGDDLIFDKYFYTNKLRFSETGCIGYFPDEMRNSLKAVNCNTDTTNIANFALGKGGNDELIDKGGNEAPGVLVEMSGLMMTITSVIKPAYVENGDKLSCTGTVELSAVEDTEYGTSFPTSYPTSFPTSYPTTDSYPSSDTGILFRSLQTTVEEAPFSFDIQLETSNNASSSASSGANRFALLVLMAAGAASLL